MKNSVFEAKKIDRIARRIVAWSDNEINDLLNFCEGAAKNAMNAICKKYGWQSDLVDVVRNGSKCMVQLPLDDTDLYGIEAFSDEYDKVQDNMNDKFVSDDENQSDSGKFLYKLVLEVEIGRMDKSHAAAPEYVGDWIASVSFYLSDSGLNKKIVELPSDSVEFNDGDDPKSMILEALNNTVSAIDNRI